LKGVTARQLFMEFPELKKKLWKGSIWSPSYYVGTAGHMSAETIKQYIEDQKGNSSTD
jgi:putative transposase